MPFLDLPSTIISNFSASTCFRYFVSEITGNEFRIFQPDIIYTREKEPKLREVEDVKGNIDTYITEKLSQIKSLLEKKGHEIER